MKKRLQIFLILIISILLIPKINNAQFQNWNRVMELNSQKMTKINYSTNFLGYNYSVLALSGNITFNSTDYSAIGISDLLVLKHDASGALVKAFQYSAENDGFISPDAIKVDASGIYISGSFHGTINIDNYTITSDITKNSFLLKLDETGHAIWLSAFLNTDTGVSEIAIDANSNVFLLSKTSKLIKFGATSEILWEQTYANNTLHSIAISGNDLFIGGALQTNTSFGNLNLISSTAYNTGFIIKGDLNGNYTDSVVIKSTISGDGSAVGDILFDANDNLIIVGGFRNKIGMRDKKITGENYKNYAFIAQCTKNLSFNWLKSSEAYTSFFRNIWDHKIFKDSNNKLYLMGMTSGNIQFDNISKTVSLGNYYLAKLDEQGTAEAIFEIENSTLQTTAISQAGKIITSGNTESYGNFQITQFSNDFQQEWRNETTANNASNVTIRYVKHDKTGNTYLQSRILGKVNYFGTEINTTSEISIISKHDLTGNILWYKTINDEDVDNFGVAFTLDKENNILTTGLYNSSLTIETTTLNSTNSGFEAYIAKYNSDGEFQWASNFEMGYDMGKYISITADSTGNIIATGVNSPDNYLLKFDKNGNKLWSKNIYMESMYTCLISADANDNIYLTSEIHLADYSNGTSTIDNITINQTLEDGSVALVKFDPNGIALWANTFGGVSGSFYTDGWASNIKNDPQGNTYLWGWCTDNSHFGNTILDNPYEGLYSFFLTKINTNGQVEWANAVYEKQYDYNYGDLLDLDKNGNIYAAGHFKDIIEIEGVEYQNSESEDFFILKYDNNGKLKWVESFPVNTNSNKSISVFRENILSTTGQYNNINSIGNFSLNPLSGENYFIATSGNLKYLELSATDLAINSSEGSTIDFTISSNSNWTVSSSQNWLTIDNKNGSLNAKITLTASANTSEQKRTATITVSSSGIDNQTITVTQNAATVTSINEKALAINVYPNPANEIIYFSGLKPNTRILIFDMNGNKLHDEICKDNLINIRKFESGIYSIKIITDNNILIKKIVKQ